MSESLASRFMAIYRGLETAHGTFQPKHSKQGKGGKLEGGQFSTKGPATEELWTSHLKGTLGIGIYTLRENGLCSFGAIDVDDYKLDLPALETRVRQLELPLIVVRTKSGGAHLFLFAKGEGLPAPLMVKYLKAWSSLLEVRSIDKNTGKRILCEIFPKQTKLSGNSVGNWLNMPYFKAEATERYAIHNGMRLDAEQFLIAAKGMAVDEAELKAYSIAAPEKVKEAEKFDWWKEAPQCLINLTKHNKKLGDGEGRQQFLTAVAIYLNKRNILDRLEDYNQRFCSPPLSSEIKGLAERIAQNNYQYSCSQEPICSVCDKPTCLTRIYGVGGLKANDDDILAELTKSKKLIESGNPLGVSWEFYFNGHMPFVIPNLQLMSQVAFSSAVFAVTGKVPHAMKAPRWNAWLEDLASKATIEILPEPTTRLGNIWQQVQDCCIINSNPDPEMVASGNSYPDEKAGLWIIKPESLLEFVKGRIARFNETELSTVLRSKGVVEGQHEKLNVLLIPITKASVKRAEPEIDHDEGDM